MQPHSKSQPFASHESRSPALVSSVQRPIANLFCKIAPAVIAAGYSPIPILPQTKRPALGRWQVCCTSLLSRGTLSRLAHAPLPYGIGIALGYGGLIAIDIDTEDPAVVAAIGTVLSASIVAKCGKKGRTDFYRDPSHTIPARKLRSPSGMLVEILAGGNQTVIPPTLHPETGQPYRWMTERTLENTKIAELPVIPPDIADRLQAVLAPHLARPPVKMPPRATLRPVELSRRERDRQRRYVASVLAYELRALATMPSGSGRNAAAFRLVCRVGRWVHAGIISDDRLTADIVSACRTNGLAAEDGERAVRSTIASALRTCASDGLPNLGGPSHD